MGAFLGVYVAQGEQLLRRALWQHSAVEHKHLRHVDRGEVEGGDEAEKVAVHVYVEIYDIRMYACQMCETDKASEVGAGRWDEGEDGV